MTRPRLERTLLGAAAALSLSLGAPAMAADHRDAPTIDDYSAIDINDVFMFRKPGDTSKLVVALSTQAVADPQFGSSYHFQENALYQLNFTTRVDAKPTAHIDFVFGPFGNAPDCPVTQPGQPAPACQKFRARFPNGVVINGFATQGTSGAAHLPPVTFSSGEITVFAGPREDPFFFDLVGFNRSIAAGKDRFTHVDAFRGKNINAMVLEFPVGMVFPANICQGQITANGFKTLNGGAYPCGAWAVTYLGNFNYDDPEKFEAHPEALRQVDRMGNPAVNTALIPAPLKDAFNFAQPKDDPKDFLGVIANQILALDTKFGTCQNGNTSNVFACNPNTAFLASVAVPDTLKYAVNLPDGFPNGRRLFDPTTNVLISLILQIPGFSDGTSAKHYCVPSTNFPGDPTAFPFLAPPLQLTDGTVPLDQPSPVPCP